ncbi:MAG: efflux RND transporter periplasmic adaptor subunit [Acidobacteria bacterium]|nr:MAG: efflux RND transporter periplasmic adaptor subunit [Acidobacteriota bacterium]REK03281.1 MAG: efflux RND transporter periplasmic adaptor subunit [Acidobacteriota bacterium]
MTHEPESPQGVNEGRDFGGVDSPSRRIGLPAVVAIAVAALFAGVFLARVLPIAERTQSSMGTAVGPGGAGHDHGAMGEDGAAQELWTCSMHPEVLEEQAGQCPICGMDLVPVEGTAPLEIAEMPGATSSTQAELWTCSMHPEVLQDHAGPCPICGMDLVPVSAGGAASGAPGQGAVVEIDPSVTQNMNVQTVAVQRRDLTRPIRTVGYLDYDQQRMVTVTTKYRGWIEKVNVNYVGEQVRRGQPLFEIYSPELVQTEQELLSAIDFARQLEGAPEDARSRAESLVESARQRLAYWDVSPERIAELERSGVVFRTLEIGSPASGLVMMRRPGLEGMAVTPGMELYHIANLSSLWLSVELFEEQIAYVRPGTPARIELAYFPGETFTGTVRFLEPALSEETRTVSARIEVENRGGRLRKGMYATVHFAPVVVEGALAVPTGAVIRTGRREVAVVALGNGRFVPHEVDLGIEAGGYVQVLRGLAEGERVVTSAQFLIDSESRLRSAVQRMLDERAAASEASSGASSDGSGGAGSSGDTDADDPHAGHRH